MAPSPLSLRILALPLSLTAAAFDPRNFTEDALLPGFHFVPWPFDWMNDPNGPMWDPVHERYHLMYQYQTPRNWGHAVSEDLVNWVQLPQALTRTESYDAGGDFSGSATILDDAAQTPVLTVSTNRNDVVFVALPADRDDPNLTNWTYPDYNPLFSTDARDPTEIFKTSGGACRVLPRRPMRWPLRAVVVNRRVRPRRRVGGATQRPRRGDTQRIRISRPRRRVPHRRRHERGHRAVGGAEPRRSALAELELRGHARRVAGRLLGVPRLLPAARRRCGRRRVGLQVRRPARCASFLLRLSLATLRSAARGSPSMSPRALLRFFFFFPPPSPPARPSFKD